MLSIIVIHVSHRTLSPKCSLFTTGHLALVIQRVGNSYPLDRLLCSG